VAGRAHWSPRYRRQPRQGVCASRSRRGLRYGAGEGSMPVPQPAQLRTNDYATPRCGLGLCAEGVTKSDSCC